MAFRFYAVVHAHWQVLIDNKADVNQAWPLCPKGHFLFERLLSSRLTFLWMIFEIFVRQWRTVLRKTLRTKCSGRVSSGVEGGVSRAHPYPGPPQPDYGGNPPLVYAVVRRRRDVTDLLVSLDCHTELFSLSQVRYVCVSHSNCIRNRGDDSKRWVLYRPIDGLGSGCAQKVQAAAGIGAREDLYS